MDAAKPHSIAAFPTSPADDPAELGPARFLDLADAEATARLGEDLASCVKAGDLVALIGDLGAGKSTLARATIRALADDDALEVPSPTFTLVQSYEDGRIPAAHFDLYRLGDPGELTELGLEEALSSGIALVEWPQQAPELLARAAIIVELAVSPEGGRRVALAARGNAEQRLARTLAIRDFLVAKGHGGAKRRYFCGDASARRYETLTQGEETLVLMDSPSRPDGPAIRDGLPYTKLVHTATDLVPFVAIARALSARGMTAPQIHAIDFKSGFLTLQHLGDGSILTPSGEPDPLRYRAVVECLARLHRTDWTAPLPLPGGGTYSVPAFDRRAMMIEAELLLDWYAPRELGRQTTPDDAELFREIWSAIFSELAGGETSIVLRDVHSPNIIWRAAEFGDRKVGFIDFQDAMIGPAAYDVASLAQDARVDMPAELEAALVSAYIAARRKADPGFDPFAFERDYAIMAAQRASKILGIFVRLLERDGKPQYLRHIPRVKAYLRRTLDHPSLAALKSLYADWGLV